MQKLTFPFPDVWTKFPLNNRQPSKAVKFNRQPSKVEKIYRQPSKVPPHWDPVNRLLLAVYNFDQEHHYWKLCYQTLRLPLEKVSEEEIKQTDKKGRVTTVVFSLYSVF